MHIGSLDLITKYYAEYYYLPINYRPFYYDLQYLVIIIYIYICICCILYHIGHYVCILIIIMYELQINKKSLICFQ